MATIQVRISDEDKKAAEKVLKAIGMDVTTAVRVYFKRIAVDGGIPFPLNPNLTVNGFTPEFEAEVLKASEEADQGIGMSGPFDNAKDMIDYLHKEAENEESE